RDDPTDAHARGHVADGLDDPLEHADLILANCNKQSQGCADVECAGKDAAPGDGPGKSLARVFNFVAHDGGELQTNEAEANHTERVQHKTRVRGNAKVGSSHGSSETKPDDSAQGNEQAAGDERAETADVVDPLADA